MKTDKWINEIDRLTSDFKTTFSELSTEELNWKENELKWCIAQNIEHLICINESYYPVIESIRKEEYKRPLLGKIGFVVNLFGRMILKSVQADRKKKMKTFPIWEPRKSNIADDILTRFEVHQDELKQMIINSQDLLKKDIVISSPANVNIVYKLNVAWDIIIAHEQRHLLQAKEVQVKRSLI